MKPLIASLSPIKPLVRFCSSDAKDISIYMHLLEEEMAGRGSKADAAVQGTANDANRCKRCAVHVVYVHVAASSDTSHALCVGHRLCIMSGRCLRKDTYLNSTTTKTRMFVPSHRSPIDVCVCYCCFSHAYAVLTGLCSLPYARASAAAVVGERAQLSANRSSSCVRLRT